jgi:hypothetical protein
MVEAGRKYSELRGVMIRGNCEVLDDPEAVRMTMRGVAAKEGSTAAVPSGASSSAPKRVVLKITPSKIASWDHSKLGGKY